MPPKEGPRGDEEGDPALTRQDPTRRCEEDPIDDTELRSYDESNTLIGATSLGPDNPAIMAGTPYICRYAFSFANVPTATFYRVKIGQHDSPAASFAQLSAAGWKYDPLTLR